MNIKHIKKSIMAILLISIILLPLFATSITPVFAGGLRPPGIPPIHIFHGNVTINNESAVDGTIVSAKIGDVEIDNITTSNGTYTFSISGVTGNVISFYINGILANQFNFTKGEITKLDLCVIIPIESITVTPDATTLNVTDTQQFTATVLPKSVHQSVVWSVDNETVGTINATTGLFIILAEGIATVTATSVVDLNIIGTAIVIVQVPPGPGVTPPPVVEINIESVTVNPNDTFTIDIILSNTPAAGVGAYGFNITFDPTIVQVKEVTNMPGIGVHSWNNEAGWLLIGGAAFPGAPDGIFGTIEFEAIGADGTFTTLDLTVVDFADDDETEITLYTIDDGLIEIIPTFTIGDVTGDGEIKPSDALSVLRIFAGDATEADFIGASPDVNGDGNIKPTDALMILRIFAGK